MKNSGADLKLERVLWLKGLKDIAGVDEAGRGPLAGPVVAAAVIFPEEVTIEGVDDSKKLSAINREKLFARISENAKSIGIGIVGHDIIDRVNILQATFMAMRNALENLSVRPSYTLVDGNSFRHESLAVQNVVGGDAKSFTIAAASIIAKVTRDRLMCEMDACFPQYGFARHKGYGTPQHIEAIRKFGLCEIHRKSFHPKMLQLDLIE